MNTGSSLSSTPSELRVRFSPLTTPSTSNSSFIEGFEVPPPPQPVIGMIIDKARRIEISLLLI